MTSLNPLRQWRKARKLSAVAVANALGTSERTIYAFELGSFRPSDESFQKIASLVGEPELVVREAWDLWNKHLTEK